MLLSLLLLSSCRWLWPGETEPAQAPPRGAAVHTAPPPTASIIEVPLSMSLVDLQESVQGKLPQVFIEEKGREIHKGVLADWTISRAGPVSLMGMADDRLRLVVPLSIDARAYTARQVSRQERRGRALSPASLDAKLTLTVDLDVDITEDWALSPEAEVSYAWAEAPVLEMGPLKLDITKAVDEKLQPKLPEIAEKVEARLRERDKLPGRIAQVWEQLTTPHALPRPESAWLVVEPTALFVTTPVIEGAALRMRAGMQGTVTTLLGEPPDRPALPLPRRSPAPPPGPDGGGLRLQVNAQVNWAELSAQASAALAGRSWPLEISGQSAGTFTLSGAELYPTGEQIAVGLAYTAESPLWSSDGTVWLTGRPALDVTEQRVRIEDFDYLIETWDLAVAGVNMDLVRDQIMEQLDQQLSFPFGEQIAEKLTLANSQLRSVDTPRGGHLTARLDAVEVRDLVLADEALVVLVELRGEARMRLPPPPPDPDPAPSAANSPSP